MARTCKACGASVDEQVKWDDVHDWPACDFLKDLVEVYGALGSVRSVVAYYEKVSLEGWPVALGEPSYYLVRSRLAWAKALRLRGRNA
jgi:hypothetical protein